MEPGITCFSGSSWLTGNPWLWSREKEDEDRDEKMRMDGDLCVRGRCFKWSDSVSTDSRVDMFEDVSREALFVRKMMMMIIIICIHPWDPSSSHDVTEAELMMSLPLGHYKKKISSRDQSHLRHRDPRVAVNSPAELFMMMMTMMTREGLLEERFVFSSRLTGCLSVWWWEGSIIWWETQNFWWARILTIPSFVACQELRSGTSWCSLYYWHSWIMMAEGNSRQDDFHDFRQWFSSESWSSV